MVADQFAQAFRNEHREIRDALFALSGAFEKKSRGEIAVALARVAQLTGPHFRYEEDALYPSLTRVFGRGHIGKLVADHDLAIGAVRRLAALGGQIPLTDKVVLEALKLIRGILPHISDCEGLSIMTETLSSSKILAILESRRSAQRRGLDLLSWIAESGRHAA